MLEDSLTNVTRFSKHRSSHCFIERHLVAQKGLNLNS